MEEGERKGKERKTSDTRPSSIGRATGVRTEGCSETAASWSPSAAAGNALREKGLSSDGGVSRR
jgi:hypothetical protein